MVSVMKSRLRMARSWATIGLALLTGACKVVTLEEDRELRERHNGSFDAAAYVAQSWDQRLAPGLISAAKPLPTVVQALKNDVEASGTSFGRRASEASAWTFVVQGEGRVTAIDDKSRAGALIVAVPQVGEVRLMIGPVVVSTALRDSVPTLRFNDFSDQIAFAAVNKALNEKALAQARSAAAATTVGDHVHFIAAFQASSQNDRLELMPIRIEPASKRTR